jgi:RNA polymerase sigma-70 factor (ECF subfamily)
MLATLLAAAYTPDDAAGRPSRGTDAALIARLRAGDERALEAVFRRLVLPLSRFARRVGADEGDAEQLVTDVFFTLWERRIELEDSITIDAYLFRAVRNRALNAIRDDVRERRRQSTAGQWMADVTPIRPDVQIETNDLVVRIRSHIAELPESQQTALFLRYTREMTLDEVASAMNLSTGAVKMLLQRAIRSLRRRVGGLFEAL